MIGMWGSRRRAYGSHPVAIDLNDFEQKTRTEHSTSHAFLDWRLSDNQQSRIEREFDSKLRILAWEGRIPPEYVSVVGRLHEYRNEMYHREESRPNALRILVHLYAWLVADLLERLSPGLVGYSSADPEDLGQRTYARMGRTEVLDPLALFERGFNMQSQMAESLREGLDLASAADLLADYAAERIESLHEAIAFSGDYIGSIQGVDKVTEMDVVRLIYSVDPMKRIEELRSAKAPVTRAMIRQWDEWPERVRAISEPVDAFRSLAEFEAEFEDFEAKVRELASDVDGEIQFQIDLARGK